MGYHVLLFVFRSVSLCFFLSSSLVSLALCLSGSCSVSVLLSVSVSGCWSPSPLPLVSVSICVCLFLSDSKLSHLELSKQTACAVCKRLLHGHPVSEISNG